MPNKIKKKTVFDIVEDYYISQLLVFLSKKDFFKNPQIQKKILRESKYKPVFKILFERTDIIEKTSSNKFSLNQKYRSYLSLDFHIEKFLLAYGEFSNNDDLPMILRNDILFSTAYQHASQYQNWNFLVNILNDFKAQRILDLGCGVGSLITQFCKTNNSFSAIGIEQNNSLILKAKKIIQGCNLKDKVKILKGDVLKFSSILKEKEIDSVDVIVAANVFNEFFSDSGKNVTYLLKQLKRNFPNKFLIILDYYQVFETSEANNLLMKHSYVHDIMQVFSGQGLTPPNFLGWNAYYEKTNCEVNDIYEGEQNGLRWFIHILKL